MRRIAIALISLCALASCSSSAVSGTNLGDTVYVDAGVSATEVPVGYTRTAQNQIAKSLAAKDTQGAAEVIGSGEGRFVNRCTSGKLIDTAFGGEREIRLPNGQAVWTDVYWLKDSCV